METRSCFFYYQLQFYLILLETLWMSWTALLKVQRINSDSQFKECATLMIQLYVPPSAISGYRRQDAQPFASCVFETIPECKIICKAILRKPIKAKKMTETQKTSDLFIKEWEESGSCIGPQSASSGSQSLSSCSTISASPAQPWLVFLWPTLPIFPLQQHASLVLRWQETWLLQKSHHRINDHQNDNSLDRRFLYSWSPHILQNTKQVVTPPVNSIWLLANLPNLLPTDVWDFGPVGECDDGTPRSGWINQRPQNVKCVYNTPRASR